MRRVDDAEASANGDTGTDGDDMIDLTNEAASSGNMTARLRTSSRYTAAESMMDAKWKISKIQSETGHP
jgi:hypothetical protein